MEATTTTTTTTTTKSWTAVRDRALQDRMVRRHATEYGEAWYANLNEAQRLAYDSIYYDGPRAV